MLLLNFGALSVSMLTIPKAQSAIHGMKFVKKKLIQKPVVYMPHPTACSMYVHNVRLAQNICTHSSQTLSSPVPFYPGEAYLHSPVSIKHSFTILYSFNMHTYIRSIYIIYHSYVHTV